MSKLAAEAGVNRENLYRMLSGREQPRRPTDPPARREDAHVRKAGTTGVGGSGWRDVFGDRAGLGDRVSVFPHAGKMHPDGAAHQLGSLLLCGASRDASWKVRNVRAVASPGLFEEDGVSHFFNPACLKILFRVFGSRSIEGWPATVTRPFLVGCLNWRWLPSKLLGRGYTRIQRHRECSALCPGFSMQPTSRTRDCSQFLLAARG